MNFIEDDPRVPIIQGILIKKINDRLDSDKQNYLQNLIYNKSAINNKIQTSVTKL